MSDLLPAVRDAAQRLKSALRDIEERLPRAQGERAYDETDDKLVSPVPAALVLLFPVIDTSQEGYGNTKCGVRWQEISPLHRVKAGAPPTIIFHGTGDTVTPFAGAQAFRTAMQKAGNRCELIVNQGGRHGYLMFDRGLYDETMQKSEDFLRSLSLVGDSAAASGQ
jgi:acetyl esterase